MTSNKNFKWWSFIENWLYFWLWQFFPTSNNYFFSLKKSKWMNATNGRNMVHSSKSGISVHEDWIQCSASSSSTILDALSLCEHITHISKHASISSKSRMKKYCMLTCLRSPGRTLRDTQRPWPLWFISLAFITFLITVSMNSPWPQL